MNFFFGFDVRLKEAIDWFFNLNHLFLLLWVAGFIVLCCFLFHAKSEKGKRATKISLAVILFVLEVGRTIYKYLMHVHNGGTASDFNWWWNISFQMCAIMTWTTIVTLILSACLKKENRFLQYLYNILFACAMIGGILTFCYPDLLSADRPFLHFENIQTVTVHALLIFVPIYLIKIKEFKVEFKNFWKVFVGYVFIGCVSMTASLISGNNFAYALNFDLIDLGLPFPWHLPVLMLILSAFSAVIYGIFELIRYLRGKKVSALAPQSEVEQKEENVSNVQVKSKLSLALYIVSIVSAIVFGTLILLGEASMIGKDSKTLLGLLCLLPLVYMILMLVFAEQNKKYISGEFDKSNYKKHITLISLTFIFCLPVGIIYLVKYLRS